MKNFIAYSAQIDEQEFFETHEEALEWLKKSDLEGAEIEGFSLEVSDGGSFIAKITHRSQYVEEENEEDFCHCEDEDCENEHWDYSQESVGHIEYKEVSHVTCKVLRNDTKKDIAKLDIREHEIGDDFKKLCEYRHKWDDGWVCSRGGVRKADWVEASKLKTKGE